MPALAFQPVYDDPANPTVRLRCAEIVRALRAAGVDAVRLEPDTASDVLVWGRHDWGLDVAALRRRHRRVVFDCTDNVLAYPYLLDGRSRRLRARLWRWRERDRIVRFLERFDALVVGSEWLAARMREEYAGPVHVIADPQPALAPPPARARSGRAVWVGMNNNLEYLFAVFGEAAAFRDVELKVVTSRRKSRRYRGTRSNAALAARLPFRTSFVEWRPESWLAEVAECAVGLAPLPPTEVTMAKTENKLTLYSALGLPFLCSDIPAYREYVARHGLGMLCRRPEDWAAGLRAVLEQGHLTEEAARRGPEVAARDYAPAVVARRYLRLYEDLMGAPCPRAPASPARPEAAAGG